MKLDFKVKSKKKDNTESQIQEKKQKQRFFKIERKKYLIIFLWGVLICSFAFAVYKNFTAIDIHTIHEKEIVQEKILNTNKIENFVSNFAKIYYSWEQSQDSLDSRKNKLSNFLTEDCLSLVGDNVRNDIPVTSKTIDVKIWNIERASDNEYSVVYEVVQEIREGEEVKNYSSIYETKVHIDENGDMVITKAPTISTLPKKSSYTPQALEYDNTVDSATYNDIKVFLDTFFKLYPKATTQELVYYVKDNLLKEIDDRFIFSQVNSLICKKENDNLIRAYVNVEYIDEATKVSNVSQFDLMLQNIDGNWKIVGINR